MARVSLDGLRIEVAHNHRGRSALEKLQAFAEDIAENEFGDWEVTISQGAGDLQLAGRKDLNNFDANVESSHGLAIVSLTGLIDLNMAQFVLAGGNEGVRRRVSDSLLSSLSDHLA